MEFQPPLFSVSPLACAFRAVWVGGVYAAYAGVVQFEQFVAASWPPS